MMRGLKTMMALALMATAIPMAAAGRPTEGFRREHAEVKEHLAHLDSMAGTMSRSSAAEQKKTATLIASFLEDHILTHAKWEEQHLYPAVDRRTHADAFRFTGSMRYEHTIVARSIAELKKLAAEPAVDAGTFERKTDRTLGLIAAHFEKEEEVFLPILDRTMTREELEKELGQ